jgi:AcrR family transcriptional regulator
VSDPARSSAPADALRRAPFGANPLVGTRGQRTRHRILDAAIEVFGQVGVHQGSIERIANEAGCSRAAFYQYFADKDDLLRHLAAQLSLQLDAAVAWLRPITADPEGWASLRELLARWEEVHVRHLPVLDALPTLFETDPAFAHDAARVRARFVSAITARVRDSDLQPGELDGTVDLFLVVLPRVFEDLGTLGSAMPESFPAQAVLDAITDVVHRSLFGIDDTINVHRHELPAPPQLPFGPLVRSGMEGGAQPAEGVATRRALLEAARTCFLTEGFHGTRIDAIAQAAGVSHGTLYTYFDSKDHVAQVLAMQALRGATGALARMPGMQDETVERTALRQWLAEYNRAQAGETAMIRVWSDALRQSGDPVAEIAPTLDWGRRRIARLLASRGFGEVDIEAAVLLALLAGLGSRERTAAMLDIAALVIERGFFGRRHPD